MNSLKNLINNKVIIIVWLWNQWKKLISFLKNEWYTKNIIWVCKSIKTKDEIIKEFNVKVWINYKEIIDSNKNNISFVFIWVNPDETQEEIYKYIYYNYKSVKVLIEKSFIKDKKLINKIKTENINHSIVKNEYLYLDFFKQLENNIYIINNILNITMKMETNGKIYNNIINNKVFLFSYIGDYLHFLKPKNIDLIMMEWNIEKWFKILLKINNSIPIIINLTKINIDNFTNNTIIYNLQNWENCIFNNIAKKSKILDKYIENSYKWYCYYFFIFLNWKIIDLLSWKINMKDEIESIENFRKINIQLEKQLSFKRLKF